jgi:hypothetical protein
MFLGVGNSAIEFCPPVPFWDLNFGPTKPNIPRNKRPLTMKKVSTIQKFD